ncbi:MAG TPA: hypothetical protein VK399_12840 [Longimicrobiaceae bacterium]|jgi:hypothetical protein|nr:hypothetical protein [Longimicrobiaceae bacterium]
MTTAILQFLVQVLILAFGVLAAAVARERGGMPAMHRMAWTLVAVFFLWRGVPGVAQGFAAFWALSSGAGSRPWVLFVEWTPAMNHTRTLVSVAMGWTLAALPLLRGQSVPRLWAGASLACLVLACTGAYAGWQEGPTSPIHLASLSVLGAVEMVGMLAALSVGLFALTLDRYLWVILSIFAVHVALNIIWYSASVNFFYPDSWYPPLQVRHLYSAASYLAGCGLAWQRLVLARRAVRVGGLLDLAGPGIAAAKRAG